MTIRRAILTVVLTGIGFGVIGCLIALGMNAFVPDYFQWMLDEQAEGLSQTQIAGGLGLAQGLIWGMVVGLVAVFTVAWSSRRKDH